MFRSPIVHGSNTWTLLDSQVAEDYPLHPDRYAKVAFSPVGPVYQVVDRSPRFLRLRMWFADGSHSDMSHRITGETEMFVLIESIIFYNCYDGRI